MLLSRPRVILARMLAHTHASTPAPLLVTMTGAAHTLSLSRRSIERLVYSGRLPTVMIGRRRMIRYLDLARLARSGCASITAATPADAPGGGQ